MTYEPRHMQKALESFSKEDLEKFYNHWLDKAQRSQSMLVAVHMEWIRRASDAE